MPPVYSESEASPKGRAVTGGNQSQRLTQILMRHYDVTSGGVLVDDIDIRNYRLEGFRKRVQKSIMSDNEIYNNKTRLRNIHKGKNKYLCSL